MRSTPLAFVAQGKYWVNNHAHILRMHDGLNDFWAAVINNIDIRPLVSGSAQPKLTAEAMGNITVACSPDVEERRGIMHYLDIQLPKLDAVMQKSMLQIDILKERRTALISAAVTGKIDVRNWQPNSNTQTAEPDLPMAAEQAAEYRV
jgi:type I restriction enzyme S subunit